MILSRIINIDQRLIVEGACSELVIAGRQKLNHIIPVIFAFGFQVSEADFFQLVHNGMHKFLRCRCHVVTAEIFRRKRFACDFMHGAAGVCHGCNFICIIFFPPVERGCNVYRYEDLTDIFAVVAAGHAKLFCQIQIIWPQDITALLIVEAVRAIPAVQRVSGAAKRIFHIHYAGSF